MNSIRVVIVDDEPLAREGLQQFLVREEDVRIVAQYGDAAMFLRNVAELKPDVIFLDIEMPRLTGFDVLEHIRMLDSKPSIIFVTAFDEYAARAFDADAVDYVLKPFDAARIARAVMRVRQKLARQASSVSCTTPRLAIKVSDKIHLIRADEIDWLEAAGNYVRLHIGRKAHLVRRSLSKFEDELDASKFVRISRSAVVNLDRVVELQALFRGSVALLMRNGTRLTMNSAYRPRLEALVTAL